jgi:hypothetical protein
MAHHLRVTRDSEGHLTARCSCNAWVYGPVLGSDNGVEVRYLSWDSFEGHVRSCEPNMTKAYYLSGWHQHIRPDERTMSTLSNGRIFSSMNRALEYIHQTQVSVLDLKPIMIPAGDPRIDFYLLSLEEQQGRLDILIN